MNNRQSDQRGVIYPLPVTPTNTEGLPDILIDEARNRVYVANSGYNRIEVSISARDSLWRRSASASSHTRWRLTGTAAHCGSRTPAANPSAWWTWIWKGHRIGAVPAHSALGHSQSGDAASAGDRLSGVQFIKSDGSQWKVIADQATLRPTNSITPAQITTPGRKVRFA